MALATGQRVLVLLLVVSSQQGKQGIKTSPAIKLSCMSACAAGLQHAPQQPRHIMHCPPQTKG